MKTERKSFFFFAKRKPKENQKKNEQNKTKENRQRKHTERINKRCAEGSKTGPYGPKNLPKIM